MTDLMLREEPLQSPILKSIKAFYQSSSCNYCMRVEGTVRLLD